MNENSYQINVGRATLVALIIFCLGALLVFIIFESNRASNETIAEGVSNELTLTIVIRTSEPEIQVEEVRQFDNQRQVSVNDYQIKEKIPFDLSQMEMKEEIPFDLNQME